MTNKNTIKFEYQHLIGPEHLLPHVYWFPYLPYGKPSMARKIINKRVDFLFSLENMNGSLNFFLDLTIISACCPTCQTETRRSANKSGTHRVSVSACSRIRWQQVGAGATLHQRAVSNVDCAFQHRCLLSCLWLSHGWKGLCGYYFYLAVRWEGHRVT